MDAEYGLIVSFAFQHLNFVFSVSSGLHCFWWEVSLHLNCCCPLFYFFDCFQDFLFLWFHITDSYAYVWFLWLCLFKTCWSSWSRSFCLFVVFKADSDQFYYRKFFHGWLFTNMFWHASKDTKSAGSVIAMVRILVFPIPCAQVNIIATADGYQFWPTWRNSVSGFFNLGSCWWGWPVSHCLILPFSGPAWTPTCACHFS